MTPDKLLAACREVGPGSDATVYAADLGCVDVAWDWLDASERERAARFTRAALAQRYAASRTLLRAVLSARLDEHPGAIAIRIAADGKPGLAPGSAQLRVGAASAPLEFNLSHADARWRLALAPFTVGIDLESLARLAEPHAIADTVLSPAELEAWRAEPSGDRPRRLLERWVGKEALLKATGDGLVHDLRTVVPPPGNVGSAVVPGSVQTWTLVALSASADCAAALACARQPLALRELVLGPGGFR